MCLVEPHAVLIGRQACGPAFGRQQGIGYFKPPTWHQQCSGRRLHRIRQCHHPHPDWQQVSHVAACHSTRSANMECFCAQILAPPIGLNFCVCVSVVVCQCISLVDLLNRFVYPEAVSSFLTLGTLVDRLVENLTFRVEPGTNLLLTGPNGMNQASSFHIDRCPTPRLS